MHVSPEESTIIIRRGKKKDYRHIRRKLAQHPFPFGTYLVDQLEQQQISLKGLSLLAPLHYSIVVGLVLGTEKFNTVKTPERLGKIAHVLHLDTSDLLDRYYEQKVRPPCGVIRGRHLGTELEKVRALGFRFSILVIETINERPDLRLSMLAHTLGIAPNTLYAMLEHRERAISIEEIIRRIEVIAHYIGKPVDLLLALYLFNVEEHRLAQILSVIYQMMALNEEDKHVIYEMLRIFHERRSQTTEEKKEQ